MMDSAGQSVLSYAVWGGLESVVRLLIATGRVEVDAKDMSGQTALPRAVEEGHEAIVKILVVAGAAVMGR